MQEERAGLEPMPSRAEDQQLVEKALEGDVEAFGALVERYERVIGVLMVQRLGRDAAADATQETFIKAFRALPSLRDPERFSSWLYGIGLRVAADSLRTRQRNKRYQSFDQATTAGCEWECEANGEVASLVAAREEHARVLAAVGKLDDPYRLVLTLRYYRHLSYREIAAQLAEPVGTVANRLHRGVKLLQNLLAAEVGESST